MFGKYSYTELPRAVWPPQSKYHCAGSVMKLMQSFSCVFHVWEALKQLLEIFFYQIFLAMGGTKTVVRNIFLSNILFHKCFKTAIFPLKFLLTSSFQRK